MEQVTLFPETPKKKNLLVAFSGGETSAFMAQWLWRHKQDEYNMVFVFANTGLEDYETINFVVRVAKTYDFPFYFIEAKITPTKGIGTSYKIVENPRLKASYLGEPFHEMCEKFGLPNTAYKHCTRELKEVPMHKFGRDYFKGEEFYTAIGIRADEMDRISTRRKERKIIYPLIKDIAMTKEKINFFWKMQPFRLELKGYEGNCVFCWKKSDKKLVALMRDRARYHTANFMTTDFEDRYAKHYTTKEAHEVCDLPPIRMYRGNRTLYDIYMQYKDVEFELADANDQYDYDSSIEEESCDAFTTCGVDN